MRLLICLLISSTLVGCGLIGKRTPEPSPLVKSECPELTALAGDTFGDTTKKLVEVEDQYHLCRKAALGAK